MTFPMNPAQPFPDPSQLETSLFPPGSRYSGLQVLKYVREDGREVAYLERRFLPPHDAFEELRLHTVTEGDRPDLIAWQYLGDAEQAWRVADANDVISPQELTKTAGERIRISLPESMLGGRHA